VSSYGPQNRDNKAGNRFTKARDGFSFQIRRKLDELYEPCRLASLKFGDHVNLLNSHVVEQFMSIFMAVFR
jgi:hypothetical protein